MRFGIDRLKQISLVQWLMIAACFHLVFTLSVFLVGRLGILPNHFDENGVGISFSVDGVVYRRVITDLAETLRQQGLVAWFNSKAPLHCRIYSFSFIFPGSILGHNILAAELFNLIFYLGILMVVYLLGREIFDEKVGLLSAVVVAVWPSFLVHSTQLIRDPISTFFLLGVMLILAMLLRRTLTWKVGIWITLTSIVVLIVFWAARGNFWNIVQAAVGIAIMLFLIRVWRERSLLLPNLVLLFVIVATVLVVPTQIQSTTTTGVKSPTAVIALPFGLNTSSNTILTRLRNQISGRRHGFLKYQAQGSNIDAGVAFNSDGDIIRYLPRATVIGFFAPFPRMWFEAGISGRSARLLSATEMLAMYLLYAAAVYCLWKEWRKLQVWLIFLTASVGMIALGLVVINAGALYRFRFVFWMMMIVLAVKPISDLRSKISNGRTD
jgi:4-amino-4-deoxy-L-arabinose transferase-like glycosyltransferase